MDTNLDWTVETADIFGEPLQSKLSMEQLVFLENPGDIVLPFQPASFEEGDPQIVVHASNAHSEKSGNQGRKNLGSTAGRKVETLNLKSASFDVHKLAISAFAGKEKEDAKARLAVSLGAKPTKRKFQNYKTLKETRKTEKEEERKRKQERKFQTGKISKRKLKRQMRKHKAQKSRP